MFNIFTQLFNKRTITTPVDSTLILDLTMPVENFNPEPASPCFCNSGKAFGECCGSTAAVRHAPAGIFIFEDYVSHDLIKKIRVHAEQCDGQRLTVIDNKNSTPDNIVKVEDDKRVAERVDPGEYRQQINELVRKIYIDLADKCFGQQLDWFETPDLMRYRAGGFYIRHADSQNIDMQNQTWSKVIDRDLSLLIYLNDDFEGGELSFTKLNFYLRPKAGMVVLFPSDQRYMHQAEQVKKGVRYAIVSWASVKGSPKISNHPPESAIQVKQ